MIIGETIGKLSKVAWFLPGFLLYAAFPPMCEAGDVLFALAPLMWLSRCGDARKSAWRWFQSGIFFWAATLSWMPAIVKNGGPWPLVVLGWGALAAYCAAYFAVYGWLSAKYWAWCGGVPLWRFAGILVVEPVLWSGLELVRSRLMGGFAWNHLGVVPANAGFGAPAALGGVYLLSALVVLVNGTFAGVAERMVAGVRARMRMQYDRSALNRWRSLETLAAVATVLAAYRLPVAREASGEAVSTLKVAMAQRNFPCVFKENAANPFDEYDRLFGGIAALAPDLVVLPESAMGEFGPIGQQGSERFAKWALSKTGAGWLLAGGTRYGDGETFNSAALYGVDGSRGVYDKVHLVPFGEFIPGDKLVPSLQKLAPVGSCTPGEPALLSAKGVPFAVAICFEDTDSALVRRFAGMGARFLCFITNDSWFSRSAEAVAHSWQATARAIETGLPVVRVGNSGVTGVITPDGRRSWLSGADGRPLVDEMGTMLDRLAVPEDRPAPTPYTVAGDIPLAVAFLLLIGAMILVKYWDRQKRIQRLT